jgi:hypothetical protein
MGQISSLNDLVPSHIKPPCIIERYPGREPKVHLLFIAFDICKWVGHSLAYAYALWMKKCRCECRMSRLALTKQDNSQADPPIKAKHMFVVIPPKRIGPHVYIPLRAFLNLWGGSPPTHGNRSSFGHVYSTWHRWGQEGIYNLEPIHFRDTTPRIIR